MVTYASRERRAAALWWTALIVVPVSLAGAAVLGIGPSIADGVRDRAASALAAAGLPSVTPVVSGRDVVLDDVPPGSAAAALAAVAGVAGVGTATVGTRSLPTSAPTIPGTGAANPPALTPLAPAVDRARLAADIDVVVAAAPVTFAPDSAELTGPAAAAVARVAALLEATPGIPVTLTGYCADTPGPPRITQQLSELRAAAVAGALVAAGVDRDRLTTAGRGAEDPLDTAAASRRVEIRIPQEAG